MSDAQRISEVIEAAYECLSFPPGEEPDWASFNACFDARAVLALRVFPEDLQVSVLSLESYAEHQMRNGLGNEGYSETPEARSIEIVGEIATVRQEFTMNFASRGVVPAVDMFTLVRQRGKWRVVAVASDMLSGDHR